MRGISLVFSYEMKAALATPPPHLETFRISKGEEICGIQMSALRSWMKTSHRILSAEHPLCFAVTDVVELRVHNLPMREIALSL